MTMATLSLLALALMASAASACFPIHSGFYAGKHLFLSHGPNFFRLANGIKEDKFGTIFHHFGVPHQIDAALSCSVCNRAEPALLFRGPTYYRYALGHPIMGPFSAGSIHPFLSQGIDATARRGGYVHFFRGCNYMATPMVGVAPVAMGYLPSIGLPCHIDSAWEEGPHMVLVRGPQAYIWRRYQPIAVPYALHRRIQVVSRPVCPAPKIFIAINNVASTHHHVIQKKVTTTTTPAPTTTTTTTTTPKPTTTTTTTTTTPEPTTTTTTTTTQEPTTTTTTTTTPEPTTTTTTTTTPEPTTTTTTTTTPEPTTTTTTTTTPEPTTTTTTTTTPEPTTTTTTTTTPEPTTTTTTTTTPEPTTTTTTTTTPEPTTTTTTTTTPEPTTTTTTTTTPEPTTTTTTTTTPEPTTTTTTTTTTTEPPKGGADGSGGFGTGGFNVGGTKTKTDLIPKTVIKTKYKYSRKWNPKTGGTLKCVYSEFHGGELFKTETKDFHYSEHTDEAVEKAKQECKDTFKYVDESHPQNGGKFSYKPRTRGGKHYIDAMYRDFKDGKEIKRVVQTYELPENTDDEKNKVKSQFRKLVGYKPKTTTVPVGPQGKITWVKNFKDGVGNVKVLFHEMKDGKEVGVKSKVYPLQSDSEDEVQKHVKDFANELGIVGNPDHKKSKVKSNVSYSKEWNRGVGLLHATYKGSVAGGEPVTFTKTFKLSSDDADEISGILATYKQEQDEVLLNSQ